MATIHDEGKVKCFQEYEKPSDIKMPAVEKTIVWYTWVDKAAISYQ